MGLKPGKKGSEGFTLVEMLIGIAIFIIVVGTGVGTLVYSIRTQRILLARQSTASELNFNIEYMSRALRMAIRDDGTCGFNDKTYDVGLSGDSIEFVNHIEGDACQRFSLESGKVWFYPDTVGEPTKKFQMNSPHTTITGLRFKASGESRGDGLEPQVTLLIHAKSPDFSTPIRLQTTVTCRNLDV